MARWMCLFAMSVACSDNEVIKDGGADAARDVAPYDAPVTSDGGGCVQLKPWTPPNMSGLKAGNLLLTASGEQLALTGYDFPAKNMADPVFADGWEVRFSHFIATFDKVTLSANPDMVPSDQSRTGAVVAEADGPWAVDLHKDGVDPWYVGGKEPGARAVAFGVLLDQNKNGDQPFATDGTRYAFGFDSVVATPNAMNVNLGPEGLCLYKEMIANGCAVLYEGTATYKGGGNCPPQGTEPEFGNIPRVVHFHYCFKSPTTYINCDNQDNDPATPLNMEPHQRGVSFKGNTYVTGEVTFHTDHPFWESLQHDTPARFDPMAARVATSPDAGADAGVPTVVLEDLKGVDYTGFKDSLGAIVNWRTCDPNYQNPNGGSRTGPMHFDPLAVPMSMNPAMGFRDYYDYSTYNQSTQGHFNGADGLCFVRRNYASPP